MNELIEFVLEKAESEATEKRARLYDALSRIIGDPAYQQELIKISKMLREAHDSSTQLRLNLRGSQH